MRFDHHLHTAKHSPDSIIDPWELIEHAREIGLNGVVITEHDYQWEADELAELAARAAPLRVFWGQRSRPWRVISWSTACPRSTTSFPASSWPSCYRWCTATGRPSSAHPFRWDQPFDEIVARHGPVFDALELVSNNVTSETRLRTQALLRDHLMGATGSSDAHDLGTLGCYFTEFDRPIHTLADFVAALHARAGQPRHREGVRLTSGPVD